uniref:Uncharacterized protein n=1 Tax=Arundo donax TaxID=35708 RepID=A0A0A8XR70_ARUDO
MSAQKWSDKNHTVLSPIFAFFSSIEHHNLSGGPAVVMNQTILMQFNIL